jgi:hypothetical protein
MESVVFVAFARIGHLSSIQNDAPRGNDYRRLTQAVTRLAEVRRPGAAALEGAGGQLGPLAWAAWGSGIGRHGPAVRRAPARWLGPGPG